MFFLMIHHVYETTFEILCFFFNVFLARRMSKRQVEMNLLK